MTITGTASRVDAAGARVEVHATVSGHSLGGRRDWSRSSGSVAATSRPSAAPSRSAAGSAARLARRRRRPHRRDRGRPSGRRRQCRHRPGDRHRRRPVARRRRRHVRRPRRRRRSSSAARPSPSTARPTGDVTIDGGQRHHRPQARASAATCIGPVARRPPVIDPGATITGKIDMRAGRRRWLACRRWTCDARSSPLIALGTILAGARPDLRSAGVSSTTAVNARAHAARCRASSIGLVDGASSSRSSRSILMATIVGISVGIALLLSCCRSWSCSATPWRRPASPAGSSYARPAASAARPRDLRLLIVGRDHHRAVSGSSRGSGRGDRRSSLLLGHRRAGSAPSAPGCAGRTSRWPERRPRPVGAARRLALVVMGVVGAGCANRRGFGGGSSMNDQAQVD